MRMPAEEQARRQRASKQKYEEKRQARRKQQRRKAKRSSTARALVPTVTIDEILEAGLTVTTHKHARNLWYLDVHGKLHREDLRSAEALIEQESKT